MTSTVATQCYRLFGGILDADIEIPELEPVAPQAPTWILRSTTGEPAPAGIELGSDHVTGDVRVRMFRHAGGLRLLYDDTGCFDIAEDGREIRWTHSADVDQVKACADLTSRVMATALYAAGTTCLHGSAVVLGEAAIGFVAPKLHGKSTLALALVRSGAKLLTDDTLPVVPGTPPNAHPGLHAARLWSDSADRVAIGSARTGQTQGSKHVYASLPDEHISHGVPPLHALYLLSPAREPQDGGAAWRTRLSAIESALVIIGHARLAPLLGGPEAAHQFRRATALAESLPVYRLSVVRDLDRLPDVVATIQSWHPGIAAGVPS